MNIDTKYTNIWIGLNSDKINFQNRNNLFLGNTLLNTTSIISGTCNVFIGNKNSIFNNKGNYNVLIGEDTGISGDYNIALGYQSGKILHSSSYNNILIGKQSGIKILTGYNNIFIGNQTGYNSEKGFNNIFIGNGAGYYERNSNRLHISNSATENPLIFGHFIDNYIKINSVLVLQETTTPHETAGALTWDGTHFKGYTGSIWVNLDNYGLPDHNDLTGLQGGSVLLDLFYHSDQPINTTDNVEFNTVVVSGIGGGTPVEGMIQWNGQNFQGYEGGVWVNLDSQGIIDHEALSNLMGGDILIGHYHSDQPINTTDDVAFNTINGGTLSGNNTGDQNDHELLDNLEGGDALHHYHSDQPINIADDVEFNSIELAASDGTKPPIKLNNGTLIAVTEEGAIEYSDDEYKATISTGVFASQYPPAYSDTYVKSTTVYAGFEAHKATNPAVPVFGGEWGWYSYPSIANERFHIDLGTPKIITRIYYENGHCNGLYPFFGAQNFTFWGSNDVSDFNDLTYANDGTWVPLTVDTLQFIQHVPLDQADPKFVYVTNLTGYRYYALKIVGQFSGGYGIVIQHIELQSGVSGNPRKGIILNDGTNLTNTYLPVAQEDGRVVDSVVKQVGSDVTIEGDVFADNLSGNNTGDQNDHEALDNLMGGGTAGHYHSDQPINIADDVEFNSIELTASDGTKPPIKLNNGTLIAVVEEGAIEYRDDEYKATISTGLFSSQYPPTQSDTHVKATSIYSAGLEAHKATDPAVPLFGGEWGWYSGAPTNQRFHIDLGSSILISRIYYENGHSTGLYPQLGAKNFTLWGSNEASDFADLTYANDGTWTQLVTDVTQFEKHVAADVVDPKYVYVTNVIPYRYYAFKFADNYAGSYGIIVQRIELQSGVSGNPRKGIILNDGTNLTNTYLPVAQEDGRVIDSLLKQVGSKLQTAASLESDVVYESFTDAAITYNVDGTVNTVTVVGLNGNKVSTMTYTLGILTKVVTTYNGRTETIDLIYNPDGTIASTTKTIT